MILILDKVKLFLDSLTRFCNVSHLQRPTRSSLQTKIIKSTLHHLVGVYSNFDELLLM